MEIDFVSPLPPVRSGIADYSADLLPHLAEIRDLRLIRLPDQDIAREMARRYPLASPEQLGAGGRLPFYQMGNNRHHVQVHDLALKHPGVLTLHDVVLHHFLIERTLQLGPDHFAAYRQAIATEHGWIGEATARVRRWPGGWGDASLFALPAHRRLLASQRGILVHSEWAAAWLREEIPGLAVRAVPMGVPLGKPPDPTSGRAFRRRHDLPEDAPLLGSFGFQTPIKRTEVVIRTLARPEMKEIHLVVAGEMAPSLPLAETARLAGVENRVHFLGFLPFDEFEDAIAATDICLNLRYPTAGETSASLLRILAVGKPSVVSDFAQSADLPSDVVVKVPLGEDEESALASRLAELLAHRDGLRDLGQAARDHVRRNHDPARAATVMAEALDAFASHQPLDDFPLPVQPSSLLASAPRDEDESATRASPRLGGKIEVQNVDGWAAGQRRRLHIQLTHDGGLRWLPGEYSDGGIALEVRLTNAEGGVIAERWMRLPFGLDHGEQHIFEIDLRRPVGPASLKIEPHILGHQGFASLGGPIWAKEI